MDTEQVSAKFWYLILDWICSSSQIKYLYLTSLKRVLAVPITCQKIEYLQVI